MNITLSFLDEYLSESFPVKKCSHRPNRIFRGVRMYRADSRIFQQDLCYIFNPDKSTTTIDADQTYILIGRDDSRFADADHLVIYQEASTIEVFEVLQDLFDAISKWEQSISEAIYSHAGIQTILEKSSEIFGHNTMAVTSVSHMIMGYVQNDGAGLSRGYRKQVSGQEYIPSIPGLETLKDLKSDSPKKVPCFDEEVLFGSNYKLLRTNLFSRQGIGIARLTIAEGTSPLKKYHAALAANLAKYLNIAIERSAEFLRSGVDFGADILQKALTEGLTDLHTVNQLQAMAGWRNEDSFRILIIRFDQDSILHDEIAHNIIFTISVQIPTAQFLNIDRNLVAVCNTKKMPVIAPVIIDWLSEILSVWNSCCGISEEFSDISHANLFYLHALFALQHAERGRFRYYEDCLTADVISCYKREHYSLCGITPQVGSLLSHDKQHNSELVKTLYYYLLSDRSHQLCSHALDIHRSTLQYRLTAIKEISGLSLEAQSPEDRMNLLLSLRLALSQKPSQQM